MRHLNFGLLINENKTKYMMCTRKQHKENKLERDNMSFESVQFFKYPGSNFKVWHPRCVLITVYKEWIK